MAVAKVFSVPPGEASASPRRRIIAGKKKPGGKKRFVRGIKPGNGRKSALGAGSASMFCGPGSRKRFPHSIRAKPKRFAHLAHKEALLSGAAIPNGPEPTWLFLAELQNEALPLTRTQEAPGWPLKNRQRRAKGKRFVRGSRSVNKARQWVEIDADGWKRFHVLRPRGLKRFPYPIRAKPKRFARLAHKEALLSGAAIPNGPEPTWLFLAELQNEALPLTRTQEAPGWPLKNRQR